MILDSRVRASPFKGTGAFAEADAEGDPLCLPIRTTLAAASGMVLKAIKLIHTLAWFSI